MVPRARRETATLLDVPKKERKRGALLALLDTASTHLIFPTAGMSYAQIILVPHTDASNVQALEKRV